MHTVAPPATAADSDPAAPAAHHEEPSQVRTPEGANLQGRYVGRYSADDGPSGNFTAKVAGLGNEEYRITFTAFDHETAGKETYTFSLTSREAGDGSIPITNDVNLGPLGKFEFRAELRDGRIQGSFSNGAQHRGKIRLDRDANPAPGVGTPPPEGAVVLFDGQDLTAWQVEGGGKTAARWRIVDQVLENIPREGKGKTVEGSGKPEETRWPLESKTPLQSGRLHLEYLTPYLPAARERSRGEGGVWFARSYKVQIVDDFGFPRVRNSLNEYVDAETTGALFGQVAPEHTASWPPGSWQVLEIDFQAPQFQSDGKVRRPGELTVVQNTICIQDRLPVRRPTAGAFRQRDEQFSGIALDDSGQGVRYRNIWFLPSRD